VTTHGEVDENWKKTMQASTGTVFASLDTATLRMQIGMLYVYECCVAKSAKAAIKYSVLLPR